MPTEMMAGEVKMKLKLWRELAEWARALEARGARIGLGGWVVLGEATPPDVWYPTEVAALVAALEAAPAKMGS